MPNHIRSSPQELYQMLQNKTQERQQRKAKSTSWLDALDDKPENLQKSAPSSSSGHKGLLLAGFAFVVAIVVMVKIADIAADITAHRPASKTIQMILGNSFTDSYAQEKDTSTSLFGSLEGEKKDPKVTKAGKELQEAGITPLDSKGIEEGEISTALKENIKGKVQKLSVREQQLKTFEALLRVTEERLQKRQTALEQTRDEIKTLLNQYDETRNAEHARLVGIFSSLEPKRAAAIFNDLDVDIITNLFAQMTPRKSAQILGYMHPQKARIVTRVLSGVKDAPRFETTDSNALDALAKQ